MVNPWLASLILITGRTLRHWLIQLGGIGLIPLGLLDNSPVPLPGSMDIATIFLAARDTHLWLYYALMATAGSVAGGFVTYRLARKGGKEALEHGRHAGICGRSTKFSRNGVLRQWLFRHCCLRRCQ